MVVLVVGVVVVLLVVVVGMQLWARGMAARAEVELQQLRANGLHATATVVRVPPGHQYVPEKGLWVQVTLTFTDAAGAEHSIKRRVLIHRTGDVKVGDTNALRYDPAAPGRAALALPWGEC